MENYKNQVQLLLNVLPEVAKEKCFALHGGTAINLFVQNMPRLSVDIDLTFVDLHDRATSFVLIEEALKRIADRIKKIDNSIKIDTKFEVLKLYISNRKSTIKIEVNQGIRGLIGDIENRNLCNKAAEVFDVFCVMPCVPIYQLYGGKICAALDRQHPRDLFDVKKLLDENGFDDKIKLGFLFCLLSSKRPILEMLFPSFIHQENVFDNQFKGMTNENFSYIDFENTRIQLLKTIHQSLNEMDKKFILDFENANPNWSVYDFSKFPSILWKLQNLEKLKFNQENKHHLGIIELSEKLNLI